MKLKRKSQEKDDAVSEHSALQSDSGFNMSFKGKKKYLNNSGDDEGMMRQRTFSCSRMH
jgi:hypothetical protein